MAEARPRREKKTAEGQRNIGGRGDAFDPSQNPAAPRAPRPLESLAPAASTPQLITNRVVRDVHDGSLSAKVSSPDTHRAFRLVDHQPQLLDQEPAHVKPGMTFS
jgi:hypothetical protein